MRKAQHAILLALAIAMGPVTAQGNSDWVQVASSNDGDRYSARKGSFEITNNKAGEQIAVLVGQTFYKSKGNYVYGRWYVTTSDCDAGMGKLVVLKINNQLDFESDFVRSGSNIASGIADTICNLYRGQKESTNLKGL